MVEAATGVDAELARLLEAGAQAEGRHEPETALGFYRQAAAIQPDNPFVLQKIAQQISDAMFLGTDPTIGRERVEEALRYAHRAVELDPSSAVNRLSLAILYGRLAGLSGVSEKVQYARLVRRYADEAHALDPDYAWACHILARWHLEMASLGSAKRALAAMLFGGLPKASREEGLRLLERAVELEPDALAHRVELGIAYERLGRLAQAREQWEMSLSLPSVAIYDEPARLRAREELARLDRGT
jgi:tetratricopeptide (TPR) repeat protein